MAKVLVIDDDAQVRRALRGILEQGGHEVEEAADGTTAIRCYREKRPQLVITDIYMPEKDGLEVVMELRNIDSNVKIIAISGGGRSVETRLLGTAELFGANRTLFKPILPEALVSAVDEVLAG